MRSQATSMAKCGAASSTLPPPRKQQRATWLIGKAAGQPRRQHRKTARRRPKGQEAKCWYNPCALSKTELLHPLVCPREKRDAFSTTYYGQLYNISPQNATVSPNNRHKQRKQSPDICSRLREGKRFVSGVQHRLLSDSLSVSVSPFSATRRKQYNTHSYSSSWRLLGRTQFQPSPASRGPHSLAGNPPSSPTPQQQGVGSSPT